MEQVLILSLPEPSLSCFPYKTSPDTTARRGEAQTWKRSLPNRCINTLAGHVAALPAQVAFVKLPQFSGGWYVWDKVEMQKIWAHPMLIRVFNICRSVHYVCFHQKVVYGLIRD